MLGWHPLDGARRDFAGVYVGERRTGGVEQKEPGPSQEGKTPVGGIRDFLQSFGI